MKVFVAGATGAIGRPLVIQLLAGGHQVVGMGRDEDALRALQEQGASIEIADALDAHAVRVALLRTRPDVVINQLTSLPKHRTPESMRAAAEGNRHLILEGGANLARAAEDTGVRRYILQSAAFLYAAGTGLADEHVPLAVDASPAIAASARLRTELEHRVQERARLEIVVLRYGFFYGPGTWYTQEGDIAEQARRQQYPVAGEGAGVWSFVHVDDAAAATVAALQGPPGVYNIVDDQPSELNVWLPAFAKWVGAATPGTISEVEARQTFGPDFLYYATRLRGASNAKAKRVLDFQPRSLMWLP